MFKLKNIKLYIFSIIGVFNTALDITIYTLLRSDGLTVIVSNVIAVSIALIGSYILNSRYTFKSKQWSIRTFLGFMAVTLVGLWFLQTAVIYMITIMFRYMPSGLWNMAGSYSKLSQIILPKILATGVSFLWNFIWYNKVIFKTDTMTESLARALDE